MKRKNDFAFKIAARDQGYESFKRTEVFKDGVLKSQNLLANNYYYSRWHAGVSWGFRPDSLRDFSTSLNFVRVNRNDRWTNLFNHPSTLNDFTNTFVQLSGSIDLSYVQRKKKYERSFVFAGRSGHEDFNNRIGHTGNKNFDSLNNISTTRSHLGIFEFNQITRRKNPGVEFGGQAYVKVLQTEYSFV
ncbi:MAG: hypothetical protein EOP53_21235 [Sphingobacteriales bacterium]|nr:MAG: hypothetical protein EOP53_21235 [Sphingobacteriales bacterium]